MNIWDVVIIAVIAALLAGVIWKLVSDRRKGKSSCGCGGNCSACGVDHCGEERKRIN